MYIDSQIINPHPKQQFFAEEHHKGRSYAELYELVQHAANLVPRLYARRRGGLQSGGTAVRCGC